MLAARFPDVADLDALAEKLAEADPDVAFPLVMNASLEGLRAF